MTDAELQESIQALQRFNADFTHIEAKEAKTDLPKHIWQTVSAFSNTPKGGTLILGVAERQRFQVMGVRNSAKLQHDLASLCSTEMEPPIRPTIELHHVNGKHIVTAAFPELPSQQKPCFFKAAGYTNGAYIRVADGDRKLTSYEVQMMLSARSQPTDDQQAVTEAGVEHLQPRLVKGLLARLRKRPGTPFARESDANSLKQLRVLVPFRGRLVCSLGGLLALGKHPQQFFPALGLTFVVYPGEDVGEPGANQERFLDNERIEGAIPDMLGPALTMLERNIKRRSVVRGLYREDISEYPSTAVREAIINALVHRDLSSASRGTPVQVHLFRNRLVIHNPGGLYGSVTVDSLGQGISASRNTRLLRVLEDVTPVGERRAVCENRGSGIGAMVHALRQSGLPAPVFEDKISTFRVTFLNTPLPRKRDRRDDIKTLLAQHETLSRAEISQALNLSEISTRKWLAVLRQQGTVIPTESKTKSKNVRYRLAEGQQELG
jgi:ATP-dependent DNA helicase RecG